MSFSDLMSSSRGPGVIGMLLALLVLVGFGTLFMFAFDEGFQGGGPTMESVLRNQADEIESLKRGIAHHTNVANAAPVLHKTVQALSDVTRENRLRVGTIDGLKQWIEKLRDQIAESEKIFESYKDEYRVYARSRAKNETMTQLITRDGVVYHDVRIKEVTAIGIDIVHRDGNKRIPFENLLDDIRDRFQYDPGQMKAAKLLEAKERELHEVAVAHANRLSDEKMAEIREKEMAEQKARREATIQSKEAKIITLNVEIQALEQEISQAQSQANAARAAGRMFIDRSSSLRGKVRQKMNEQARLRSEIADLRARQ